MSDPFDFDMARAYGHWREVRAALLGDWIAEGQDRIVWELRMDPDKWVVKIQKDSPKEHQNQAEALVWSWLSGTKHEKWLAPIGYASPNYGVILQRRVRPLRPGEEPKRLPRVLNDLKRENFGILDGRVVACDYGLLVAALRGCDWSSVKTKWRER